MIFSYRADSWTGNAMQVLSGGTLAPGSSGGIGTLSIGGGFGLGLAAGSAMQIKLASGGNAAGVNNDTIAVTGDVAVDPSAVVNVSVLSGTPAAGDYTLLTATGTLTGCPTLGTLPAGVTASIQCDAASVVLDISAVAQPASASGTTTVPMLSQWAQVALAGLLVLLGGFGAEKAHSARRCRARGCWRCWGWSSRGARRGGCAIWRNVEKEAVTPAGTAGVQCQGWRLPSD